MPPQTTMGIPPTTMGFPPPTAQTIQTPTGTLKFEPRPTTEEILERSMSKMTEVVSKLADTNKNTGGSSGSQDEGGRGYDRGYGGYHDSGYDHWDDWGSRYHDGGYGKYDYDGYNRNSDPTNRKRGRARSRDEGYRPDSDDEDTDRAARRTEKQEAEIRKLRAEKEAAQIRAQALEEEARYRKEDRRAPPTLVTIDTVREMVLAETRRAGSAGPRGGGASSRDTSRSERPSSAPPPTPAPIPSAAPAPIPPPPPSHNVDTLLKPAEKAFILSLVQEGQYAVQNPDDLVDIRSATEHLQNIPVCALKSACKKAGLAVPSRKHEVIDTLLERARTLDTTVMIPTIAAPAAPVPTTMIPVGVGRP